MSRHYSPDAVKRREEMDRRNAKRRAEYAKGVGEYAGRPVRLWDDPEPVAIPDTDFDEFLDRRGW